MVVTDLALVAALLLAGGTYHTVGVMNGTPVGWGRSNWGQLCSEMTHIGEPSALTALRNVVSAAAGGRHSLLLLDDGSVFACGDNRAASLASSSPSWGRNTAGPAGLAVSA